MVSGTGVKDLHAGALVASSAPKVSPGIKLAVAPEHQQCGPKPKINKLAKLYGTAIFFRNAPIS